MVKIATPISHLFEDKAAARRIMRYSDCLECRDRAINSNLPRQEVFHCDIQPIHELSKADFEYLGSLSKVKPGLKLLTFHAASSCDRPRIRKGAFIKGGKEYTKDRALKNARDNFTRIRKIIGKGVKLAVENNNYYPTQAYKYVTDTGFLSSLVRDNGIGLVFDIAHARITARNRGLEYGAYREKLPLDRVVQLHISAPGVSQWRLAYDSHRLPGAREWDEVRGLLDRSRLSYLTIEYYRNVNGLIRALKSLREII